MSHCLDGVECGQVEYQVLSWVREVTHCVDVRSILPHISFTHPLALHDINHLWALILYIRPYLSENLGSRPLSLK